MNRDTPSPSRSPGPQSPAHNAYSMYNQSHQQGQHGMMNGGSSHQRFAMQMNLAAKQYQHQNHQHQAHQQHQQHHDHAGHGGHAGNFGTHQHTISGGTLSNNTPSFTPNHLQNGTSSGLHGAFSKPPNEHWAKQLELAQLARESTIGHFHARNSPSVNKSILAGAPSTAPKESEKEERNRAVEDEDTTSQQIWVALDFGGQKLRSMSSALFQYQFLNKLYLNSNKLRYIPPAIGRLRNLAILDVSLNDLTELPPEMGVLVSLKELLAFDNRIETLPYELGSLYQLEILGIEGNPLNEQFKSVIVEQGTSELIRHLRENAPGKYTPHVTASTAPAWVGDHANDGTGPDPPTERDWIVLDDTPVKAEDKFSVLSYNILCEKYATPSHYGYTPSAALSWDHRKAVILDELRARDADIVCLQEIDSESYNDYFRGALALQDYKGVFWPKSRARTMAEKEAKLVDGCAIFYKNSR